MLNIDIPKDLRLAIDKNQTQLKNSIRNHQVLLNKLKDSGDVINNVELQKHIEEAQQQIITVGLEQKTLIDRLRRELKAYQRKVKTTTVNNGIEERTFNLTTALSRARKQNIITRSASVQSASPSEESEAVSGPSTPEPASANPINPQDICQAEFLTYFGLATHEVFKEIQNKRAERKRRRTANPQFLYTKGWDISKRKRNLYLASNVSPPNTRQAVRNKNRGNSPPTFKRSRPTSPNENKKNPLPNLNLPSGLTIERINQVRSNADNKSCIECRLGGNLNICEVCTNGFHISCHNRPLVQQPKHCPRCYKEMRNTTSPNSTVDLSEKFKERQELLEKNKELTAELTQLQDRHSQLTISLKSQESSKQEMLASQQTTTEKIKKLVAFINNVKAVPETIEIL